MIDNNVALTLEDEAIPTHNLAFTGSTGMSAKFFYKGEEVVDQLEIVDARSEDPDDCLKVQLWKYNPSYFAREGCVDPVSLACTFKGNEDEGIEMSIEELLEEL